MRRALVAEWPALSQLYGLHPWDVDRLTPDELIAYRKHLQQTIRRAEAEEVSRGR